MSVISVRLDDETEQWIRDHGQKPGTFCRLAVMKEVRRIEIDDARTYLRAHPIRLPEGISGTEMVRQDRDRGHHPEHGY